MLRHPVANALVVLFATILQLFSFDRCVSRLLEMQSEEYINGCAAFREANIREKNVAGTNRNEKGRPAVLPHSTEVSLSLQDVSTYYSPWDLESRQLHLQPPSNQLLLQAWRDEVLVLGDACDRSGMTLPVPPSVPSTNAEDNIIVHLNHLLDPAAGLPRLPLSAVYSIVQRVVKDQTGVDSFVPSSTTVSQLLHLLETYDIVHESHKIVGSKHNYHFRRRSSKEADKHRGFFSFNAFVAAIHKHPIIILL